MQFPLLTKVQFQIETGKVSWKDADGVQRTLPFLTFLEICEQPIDSGFAIKHLEHENGSF